MVIALIGLVVLCAVIFYYFVSPRVSPIPYFPSNKKDIPLIVRSLRLKNGQTVYDLGAGDGVVIFAAARHAYDRRLDTQFVALEINPLLVLYMKAGALLHPNRKNITVLRDDIFSFKYDKSKTGTFFTYISPWYMERVYRNICRYKTVFRFVSYYYPLPDTVHVKPVKKVRGVHTIYEYTIRK